MINQMNRTQPLGPVNFSEEDLRKLAMLLQQMPEMQKNINGQQHEMSYLTGAEQDAMETVRRDSGLTQSLAEQGKEMQPRYENGIRAFPAYNPGGTESEFGKTTSTTTGDTTGDWGTSSSTDYNPYNLTAAQLAAIKGKSDVKPSNGDVEVGTTVQVGKDGTIETSETGPAESEQQPGETAAEYYERITGNIIGTEGDTGDGTTATATTATTATVTPTKYKDKNGNEYDSQGEADTANATIDANITTIEGLTLTTDTTFTSWMLANKDTYSIPPNSEAGLEGAFNNAKIIATDAAAVELPKMVDSMNVFLRDNELGASASYDEWAKTYPKPANLSETTMRTMYAKAVFKAERKEAFTLTTEELESWMRPPVVIATADNFNEWWEGKKGQFKESGTFNEREFAEKAHAAAIVGDAAAVTIGTVGDATAPTLGTIAAPDAVTVGTTGDVTDTTVDAISAVTDADMDTIFEGGVDDAEALLVARVEGTAVSPAEVQLKRSVENNLRMLLGATVGADADPARVRQLRNIWADMTQEVTGKAAEIRSAESMAAESELVALYAGKSTMKLQARLANLEVEKETAFKNADIALASKLANQATRLAEVITQANIDKSLSEADLKSRTDAMIAQGTMDLATALANLQVKKDLAIAQGKVDLATSLANLQKNIILAQTNVEIAVKQRSLDDALAIISYKGQMAMMDLEVDIDFKQMDDDLARLGIKTTVTLAEMDAKTQKEVATLIGMYNREAAKTKRDNDMLDGLITLLGTALGGYAALKGSDIRAKTNISPGSGEVESFLDALNAYTYEYKDPDAPGADAGMFAGVMAQDLEKTPMGASFVQDTPQGKQVDYGHGLAAILASQANIHDRLKHLEEG